MKHDHLSKMIGGWFIGDFQPTVAQTGDFEVAVKRYKSGDREAAHHHRLAEEITVIATGRVRMCDREFGEGDIVHLDRGDSTSFEALEDTITVVVKWPSVRGDKYLD